MKTLLTLLLLLSSLYAQRSGAYVGAGYGYGMYDSDDRLSQEINSASNGTFRLTLGAYINENFSLELDYSIYNKFDGFYEDAKVQESFSIVGVSVLPHYPFYDDTFDLYGKLGAGQIFWNETGEHRNNDAAGAYILGIGLGYRMQSDYLLKIGYDLTSFGLDDTLENKNYEMRLDLFYMAFEVKF
ncbi:MAG: outer membrane beta-barrel protein [Campylobacterota bacterium]|nr:outer membrane beta-barrel protein [Campylobacterota bacterium]